MLETWHPLGVVRRHHGVQLSRRRMGVERGAGAGMRQRGRLEAVGKGAAHRRWRRPIRLLRTHGWPSSIPALADDRRSSSTATLRRANGWWNIPTCALISATGSTGMGQRGRRGLRTRIRAEHPRTGRQQRRDRRVRPRISILRCARSSSRRRAPPASAARRCAVCSSTRDVYATLVARLQAAYASIAVGDPRDARNAGRSADRRRGVRRAPANARRRDGRRRRGSPAASACSPTAGRTRSTSVPRWPKCRSRSPTMLRETFAPILYALRLRRPGRGDRAQQRGRAWTVVVHLHAQSARTPRSSCRRAAATAGSPTSTSAPAARKSAARSAAKSRRAAAANPARTRGRATCAARPAPINFGKDLPLAQGDPHASADRTELLGAAARDEHEGTRNSWRHA